MGGNDKLRVVAFGGGTGLPVLLRGLRDRVGDLAAVVTVADDGGSSGRLRQELGVAPPGDVRNCLAALADMSGGFLEGVEQAGRFLRVKGRVFPAASESLTLFAHHSDGTVSRGESAARDAGKPIKRVAVEPEGARAPAGAIEAVENADVVVLSPGSLFTSTIPALLGGGMREALGAFGGAGVYV